jgi:hypothetical protein
MDRLSFSIGKAGWVRFAPRDGVDVYVRFIANERGRLVAHEMFIDSTGDGPITLAMLREVPIDEIEAALNSDRMSYDLIATPADGGLDVPVGGPAAGSNVAVLASHYAHAFNPRREPATWVEAAGRALTEGVAVARQVHRAPGRRRADSYRLRSGPGPDGLTDNFLARVARAYAAAIARGEPPNKTITEDLGPGTSPRTVERWVYEARKRKIMTAARMGARG